MIQTRNDHSIPGIPGIEEFDHIPLTRYQCIKIIKLFEMIQVTDNYRRVRDQKRNLNQFPMQVWHRDPITIFIMKPKGYVKYRYFMKLNAAKGVDLNFVLDNVDEKSLLNDIKKT